MIEEFLIALALLTEISDGYFPIESNFSADSDSTLFLRPKMPDLRASKILSRLVSVFLKEELDALIKLSLDPSVSTTDP